MLEIIIAQNPFIGLLLAYLLGSIPFGVILTKMFGKGNLQRMGSGNIGATNVVRTQGKLLGFSTFFLDFVKGIIACEFLRTGNEFFDLILPAMPVVGHIFPIWLKFKGGKGVATYFAVFLSVCHHCFDNYSGDDPYTYFVIAFVMFLSTVFAWGIMFAITETVGIASIVGACFSLVVFYTVNDNWHLDYTNQLRVLVVLVLLIIVKHKTNILDFYNDLTKHKIRKNCENLKNSSEKA